MLSVPFFGSGKKKKWKQKKWNWNHQFSVLCISKWTNIYPKWLAHFLSFPVIVTFTFHKILMLFILMLDTLYLTYAYVDIF